MRNFEYDLKPVKIVRDLIHGYINLTRFDLDIIDTHNFQRLKDVRQLTCEHVYPSAKHTRFEHSLGVMELTRTALKHINKNGFINKTVLHKQNPIISDELIYNASLAALLHDVGHCPFSHMGETLFDSEDVRISLVDTIKACLGENGVSDDLAKKLEVEKSKEIGAVHEQLSCIVILSKYKEILDEFEVKGSQGEILCADYELIIRSILGIEYAMDTAELLAENGTKNVIVRLINSKIFDMDKLDYIMRDSYYTGIGTPQIDTKRLFRNIYLNDYYNFVFTSKAVPPLQNMIDARDGLYMYVYNHHAVVYSDFLYTYIARRISKNTNEFFELQKRINAQNNNLGEAVAEELGIVEDTVIVEETEMFEEPEFVISKLGLVSLNYIFSVCSIESHCHSDSDWISLLNIIHTHVLDDESMIATELSTDLKQYGIDLESGDPDLVKLSKKIYITYSLIKNLKNRRFLKPWWKTVFEYTNFMNKSFRDDLVRKKVGEYICEGGRYGLDASEFRSQIAKHVIYITQKLFENSSEVCKLVQPLEEGDFFVIQRSTRFFSPDTIEKLEICLNDNEILGAPSDVNYKISDYYVKSLTNIIPQKNYSSIYAKEGFYVFSRPLYPNGDYDKKRIRNHYKQIENIFVFVVTTFVKNGEQEFNRVFMQAGSDSVTLQDESLKNMYEKYINKDS